MLSSANSINIGRLAPQVVYYFRSYADLVKGGRIRVGDKVNYVVPTGNFGDILAGYFAKCMGLPVGRLVCASNANDVLTEFISTGRYDRRRPFYKTTSPSMDILVSSNLERLLFLLSRDPAYVAELMRQLREDGVYQLSDRLLAQLKQDFSCGCCDDKGAADVIRAACGGSSTISATPTPPWPGPWRSSSAKNCMIPVPRRWCCPPPRPTNSLLRCCLRWAGRRAKMSSS